MMLQKPYRSKTPIALLVIVILVVSTAVDAGAFDKHRLSFSIGSDWTNYNIKGVKNTLYQFPNMAEPESLTQFGTSRISGGWGLNMSIKYQVSRSFSIGPSLIYIGTKKTEYFGGAFLDDYINRYSKPIADLKVGLLAPSLSMSFQLLIDKMPLRFNGDIAWMFGSAGYSYWLYEIPPTITYAQTNFSGQGMGFVLSMSPAIPLGKGMSIAPVMGYRFFKTGELKDDSGKRWYNMKLDFSGPFVGMGIGLK
jgi:hypothetical protein